MMRLAKLGLLIQTLVNSYQLPSPAQVRINQQTQQTQISNSQIRQSSFVNTDGKTCYISFIGVTSGNWTVQLNYRIEECEQ